MEKIHGEVVKDVLNQGDSGTIAKICKEIGENLAKLHNCGIIHGDLTSSNLIVNDESVYFLDFGLGTISDLVEDKGVDLLVFKKAISGVHNEISDECMSFILKGYEDAYDFDAVNKKVAEIENRGRYTGSEVKNF